MIRYLKTTYNLLIFTLFSIMLPAIFAAKISPCRVQNIIAQPQFGISLSTKKMVDIIQIPPLLSQTLQIGICLDNNRNFTDYTQPNLSTYICRQRYSAVEVYSKSEDASPKTYQSPIAPEQGRERLLQKLVKTFVIVEAGCDFSFNFLPVIGHQLKMDSNKEQFYSPEAVGISSLYDEKATKDLKPETPPSVTNVVEAAEAQMGSKSSILSPRSMDRERKNFFRNWHFKSARKSLEPNNTSKVNLSQHNGTAELSEPAATNVTNDDGGTALQSTSNDDLNENREEEGEEKVEQEEDKKVGNSEGEFYLNPKELGLPILILDSSIDPVMKLISRFINESND
ncbi:hypothetical protein Ocin01_10091 [Orchesella cincta]|uniref:Uncharacterized protein n=1 Tax=Orchesella cincta TaxID=48709 RepID=A0A1D2MU28_ORCCI|nr:hypothetical protein Ocin01_10091 [Orchesella cincta]